MKWKTESKWRQWYEQALAFWGEWKNNPPWERVWSSRFGRQIVISTIALAVVWSISVVPYQPVIRLKEAVKTVVTANYDVAALVKHLPSWETVKAQYRDPILQRLVQKQPASAPVETKAPAAKMVWPASGEVISAFGMRQDPKTKKESMHEGIDIKLPEGSPVRAVLPGKVVYVANLKDYGKIVEIDHGQGLSTVYAHNSEILVKEKDEVTQGAIIAKAGASGNATTPHLHFEVRLKGTPVDPYTYLSKPASSK